MDDTKSAPNSMLGGGLALASAVSMTMMTPYHYTTLYGLGPGLAIWLLGNKGAFRMQAQVLGDRKDESASKFKDSISSQSNMTSVAASIIASIAISGFSLPDIGQTHWTATALFTISLVSGIMSVYFAVSQTRHVGHLLEPLQIRAWIRGETDADVVAEQEPLLQHFDQPLLKLPRETQRKLLKPFTPGVAAVLSSSASDMLIGVSLLSLVIAYGVYLGFIWRRNLGPQSPGDDNENIFIVYVVTLVVCFGVYFLFDLVQASAHYIGPHMIILQHFHTYFENRLSEKVGTATPPLMGLPQSLDDLMPQLAGKFMPQAAQKAVPQQNAGDLKTLSDALQQSIRLRSEAAKAEELVTRQYKSMLDKLQAQSDSS